jgi:hypothetical protein
MRPTLFYMGTLVVLAILTVRAAVSQNPPEVKLTVESANPRAVESRTEQSIVRDYTIAWKNLAEASEKSSPALLDAYFVGGAKNALTRELTDQQKTGTHVRYLNQIHNLKAVFYSPEGDVMQLQDSAEYQMQVVSDDKVIHDEHVLVQYIVLMTPGADRWIVRQLQAVPAS